MPSLSSQAIGRQADSLEETHQNLDLSATLGVRAVRALSHLDPNTAPRTDVSAERKAARAALVYAVVVIAVVAAVAASFASLSHAAN